MGINKEAYFQIVSQMVESNFTLVAVSKTKPVADILELYNLGHRDFGENYVQELIDKKDQLPADIRWHFIGHLQSNKVKSILPFVHLIHGVDSVKLLKEIDKQSELINKTTNCLLQVHIAEEEAKFGFDKSEVQTLLDNFSYQNIHLAGLMGMATFTDDEKKIVSEFKNLNIIFGMLQQRFPSAKTLSMGMSQDYKLALKEGSNMIRVGSLLFGSR